MTIKKTDRTRKQMKMQLRSHVHSKFWDANASLHRNSVTSLVACGSTKSCKLR